MRIKQARNPADIREARRLFREYETYLAVDLRFQKFEEELAALPGKYAPPGGSLLLAFVDDRAVGCVAVRGLDEHTCEMKRLFVTPQARGSGLGRQLAQQIIRIAQRLGYSKMRLDTLDSLVGAMHLYETLGFHKTDPYYDNPLPKVVYWELDLHKKRDATADVRRPNH